MRRALMLLLFVGGCYYGPSGTPVDCEHGQPRQCEAEAITWNQMMDETDPAPLVQWDAGLVTDPKDGHQYQGLYFSHCDCVELFWPGSFDASAYAHELMHSHLGHLGRDDCDHCDPAWQTLPAINARLRDAGL